MALTNLMNVSFTEAELATLNQAIQSISGVLNGKVVNLTPDQRQQYGSINEENKLLVNKVKDSEANFPEFHPSWLDKDEFDADYTARSQMESLVERLQSIAEKFTDTKILLDHDNLNYAVSYYRYIKMLSTQEVPGSTSVYENLRQVYESQLAAARRAMNEKNAEMQKDQPEEDI